MKFEEHCNHA